MPDMYAEFKIFRDLYTKFSIMIIKLTARGLLPRLGRSSGLNLRQGGERRWSDLNFSSIVRAGE
jgi:hypothetical protein